MIIQKAIKFNNLRYANKMNNLNDIFTNYEKTRQCAITDLKKYQLTQDNIIDCIETKLNELIYQNSH